MRIGISFGFVIIITLIIGIAVMSLSSIPLPESTSFGMLLGELLMAGIFMINQGITYDTKKRRFEEW